MTALMYFYTRGPLIPTGLGSLVFSWKMQTALSVLCCVSVVARVAT